jgi:hypothetical protein
MRILFYPEPITPNCRLWFSLIELGIEMTNDPTQPYDYFLYWSYHKTKAEQDDIVKNSNCLNKGCYDITKRRVNNVFDNIIVDPETFTGLMVRKSEDQCSMDDKMVKGPTRNEPGYIYRKFIDTKVGDYYIEYRLFYFGEIKFIATKKYIELFSKDNFIWSQPLSVIPIEKRMEIESSCKKFGFDFGEIDVLRDVDGQFYVVDLNNIAGYTSAWFKSGEIKEEYNDNVRSYFSGKSSGKTSDIVL